MPSIYKKIITIQIFLELLSTKTKFGIDLSVLSKMFTKLMYGSYPILSLKLTQTFAGLVLVDAE